MEPIDGKPKVGDRVRVVMEGEVGATWPDGFALRDRNAGYNIAYSSDIVKDTVVIRRRYRAGDAIGRDNIVAWEPPAGTLVRHVTGARHYMKLISAGRWTDSAGALSAAAGMMAGDYDILVVGE